MVPSLTEELDAKLSYEEVPMVYFFLKNQSSYGILDRKIHKIRTKEVVSARYGRAIAMKSQLGKLKRHQNKISLPITK